MNEAQTKIANKIRALLQKTTEQGATEAEAMSAAQKVSELLSEYDLTLKDIQEIKDGIWGKRAKPFGTGSSRRRYYHEVQCSTTAIGVFCDCKAWLSGEELVFFGTKHDTEIAFFMVDMIKELSDKCYREYESSVDCMLEKAEGIHGKTIRANFMLGFMTRVNTRLKVMKQERDTATGVASTTGRELVVVKSQELERRFKDTGLKLGNVSVTRSIGNQGAFSAGIRAGNNADLGRRGIAGSQKSIR